MSSIYVVLNFVWPIIFTVILLSDYLLLCPLGSRKGPPICILVYLQCRRPLLAPHVVSVWISSLPYAWWRRYNGTSSVSPLGWSQMSKASCSKTNRSSDTFHIFSHTKQKRSTEGCSKFKSPETRQFEERLVSIIIRFKITAIKKSEVYCVIELIVASLC